MTFVVEVHDGDEIVRGVALQSEHPPADEPEGFSVPPLVPIAVAGVAGVALVGAVVTTVGFAVTEQGVYALDAEWRAARADTSRPFGQKEADQANAEITAAQSVANVWGVAALATGAVAVVAGAGAAVLWFFFTDAE
jgi:hypothetical protein